MFVWPQEDKNIWATAAYPEGKFTNHELIKILGKLKAPTFSLLDIGCGNGLFVQDVIDSGNLGVGLDGCHFYQDYPGFLWKRYPGHGCILDATKPYEILMDEIPLPFDFITSWEHLEHILEDQVHGWLTNILKHSYCGTKYIFSISYRKTGSHFLIKDKEWWTKLFEEYGLVNDDSFAATVAKNYVRDCNDSYYFHLRNVNPFSVAIFDNKKMLLKI